MVGVSKGLWSNWLERPGGTPQVLGLTPRGSEFQAGVKKIISSVPRQSTGLRIGPVSQGDGAAM